MAHSRQKRSPEGQQTGSVAGRRQRAQLPKGRKESRVRREDCEPHWTFMLLRSWEVKIVLGGGMVGGLVVFVGRWYRMWRIGGRCVVGVLRSCGGDGGRRDVGSIKS